MADAETIPVWRVMAFDPVRRVWTIRSKHDEEGVAREHAEALQHKDKRLRVRIWPGTKRLLYVKPVVNNKTRQFRQEQAGRMIELADAKKRYKSPG